MNLDRIGTITSELSSSLIKSIVVPPGGLLGWLTRSRVARERQRRQALAARQDAALTAAPVEYPAGAVVLFGGAPAPDEAVVEAIHRAGGRAVRTAVIPAAAVADPAASAAEAMRLFTRFGMKKVEWLPLEAREQATSPDWCSRLESYDAIVLCGESAAQGLKLLQATMAATSIGSMLQKGKLLVGFDGGAAMLGTRAFASQGDAALIPGLGVLPDLVIDSQFSQPGRRDRMTRAVTAGEHASLLGVGLDSGAALVVVKGEARVLGESHVTFVDPSGPETPAESGAEGPGVQVLTDGCRMHLRSRRAVSPAPVGELAVR